MKLNEMDMAGQPPKAAIPPQSIAEEVFLEKYAKGDERTVDEVQRRVARALAAVEAQEQRAAWEESFYRAQVDGPILGGRINSAAGTELKATLTGALPGLRPGYPRAGRTPRRAGIGAEQHPEVRRCIGLSDNARVAGSLALLAQVAVEYHCNRANQ